MYVCMYMYDQVDIVFSNRTNIAIYINVQRD